MNTPLILEIKHNSLDDGQGIRSVVFVKGCPLNCIWCHNPESKSALAQISFDKSKCIGCKTCLRECQYGALVPGLDTFIVREKCTLCFKCASKCPARALEKIGKNMTVDEILNEVISDKIFYDTSGGGVTLSGGEVCMFPEWTGNLAAQLKANGINVLIETCGFFDYSKVSEYILPYVDTIFYDIKLFDSQKHKEYCGVYNDSVLSNFVTLHNNMKDFGFSLLPRVPLIPNITDTDDNLSSIAAFLSEENVSKVQLLPYNPTWYNKAEKIGTKPAIMLQELRSFPAKEQIEHAKSFFTDKNINVGGSI